MTIKFDDTKKEWLTDINFLREYVSILEKENIMLWRKLEKIGAAKTSTYTREDD